MIKEGIYTVQTRRNRRKMVIFKPIEVNNEFAFSKFSFSLKLEIKVGFGKSVVKGFFLRI